MTPKKRIQIPPVELDFEETPVDREVAQRDPIRERYDILDPNFLHFMALIADYGAKKYGESNWKKSRMTGSKSPINHIYKHLGAYQKMVEYDHSEIGVEPYIHLAAIAFNAMMEFYHAIRELEEE